MISSVSKDLVTNKEDINIKIKIRDTRIIVRRLLVMNKPLIKYKIIKENIPTKNKRTILKVKKLRFRIL